MLTPCSLSSHMHLTKNLLNQYSSDGNAIKSISHYLATTPTEEKKDFKILVTKFCVWR